MVLNINGFQREVSVHSWEPLLDVLREKLHLRGAKRACVFGGCGACTVLIDGSAYYSCMTPVVRCLGKEIVTIEGLSLGDQLDPLQEHFAAYDAAQCGYCTPGMILMAKALLNKVRRPSERELRWYLVGNLCRCTGYKKILQAVLAASGQLGSQANVPGAARGGDM